MTVARESSFRAAADKLNLSITPVNKGVHDLEHYVGYKLFHRIGGGVKLTPSGISLFNELEPVISSLKSIQDASKKTQKKKITIAVGGFCLHELSKIVIDIYKSNNIVIELINENDEDISKLILSNSVDMFILNTTSHTHDCSNKITMEELGVNELKIAISNKYFYQTSDGDTFFKEIPLAQLSTTITPSSYSKILEYRKSNNINTPIFKMANLDQVLSLVNSGEAISFVSPSIEKTTNWNNFSLKLINSPIGKVPLYSRVYFFHEDIRKLSPIVDRLKSIFA